MSSTATTIKTAIKTVLAGLVADNTLGEVQSDDFRVSSPLDRDFAKYPAAVVFGPAIEAEPLTNSENVRTYTYGVTVMVKAEGISADGVIEDLAEKVMDAFDADPTLGGKADLGVVPASSTPEPATVRGKSLVVFSIVLKAKASRNW